MRRAPRTSARAALAVVLATGSALVLGAASGSASASAPAQGAPCVEGDRRLTGTVIGEDGRFVSAQVSFIMFDADRRLIGLDGCPRGDGYPAAVLVNAKPGSSCCFILPGVGATTSPHVDGVASYELGTSWTFNGIPDNVVEVWIETYTKRAGGQPNSTNERYGHSVRRVRLPAPLPPPPTTTTTSPTTTTTSPTTTTTTSGAEPPASTTSTTTTSSSTSTTTTTAPPPTPPEADPVHIVQPLRCGIGDGDHSGSTGAISGRVFLGGAQVTAARVSAFSVDPDPGNGRGILGFGVLIDHPTGGYYLDALAPGNYSIFVTAGGLTRRFDGLRVGACSESTTDVAVTGELPRGPGTAVAGDWDGDGDDEPAAFVGGRWHLRSDAAPDGLVSGAITYGSQPGDVPVAGDWDGDGDDEPGIYRRGEWHLRSDAGPTGTTASRFRYGVQPGDVPVVGDWDGDGDDEPGIFRRGTWHLRSSSSANGTTAAVVTYGLQGADVPVAGDWDGDGDDEPGIFRRGTWHLRSDASRRGGTARVVAYGAAPGDRPVGGDWDGDAPDEPGIQRGGTWHLRGSSTHQSTIATYPFPG